jgi:hypothetical protein
MLSAFAASVTPGLQPTVALLIDRRGSRDSTQAAATWVMATLHYYGQPSSLGSLRPTENEKKRVQTVSLPALRIALNQQTDLCGENVKIGPSHQRFVPSFPYNVPSFVRPGSPFRGRGPTRP